MSSEWQESFGDRLIGVIRLNRPIYEAIKRDPRATTQALVIVIFLGLATGIALTTTSFAVNTTGLNADEAAVANVMTQALNFETNGQKVTVLVFGVVYSLLSWFISAWLIATIGNRMSHHLGDRITSEQMRRLIGWGNAPQLASFLSPIPIIGGWLSLAGGIWAIVTGVMAVRTAFSVGIGRAVGILLISAVVLAIPLAILLLASIWLSLPSI